jgi:hypothetical protein
VPRRVTRRVAGSVALTSSPDLRAQADTCSMSPSVLPWAAASSSWLRCLRCAGGWALISSRVWASPCPSGFSRSSRVTSMVSCPSAPAIAPKERVRLSSSAVSS